MPLFLLGRCPFHLTVGNYHPHQEHFDLIYQAQVVFSGILSTNVVEIRLNVAPVSTKSFAATPHTSMSMNRHASNPTEFTATEGFLLALMHRLCSALFFIPPLVTRDLCIVSKLSFLMRLICSTVLAHMPWFKTKIARFRGSRSSAHFFMPRLHRAYSLSFL